MAQTIYIVRELNVPESVGGLTNQGTIWVSSGQWDPHAAPRRATKVAGRVPVFIADQVAAGLRVTFEKLGYEVVMEIAADD